MVYLIFGNQSEGIYRSYVVDVCTYLSDELGQPVRIIGFLSLRNFKAQRASRKAVYKDAIFLPMFPFMQTWKWNILTLLLIWPFIGRKKVMALSPLAANLALTLKKIGLVKTLIYDSEGAVSAEWNEYDVVPNEQMKERIGPLEERVVRKSDFRRVVSHKMINWFERTYDYESTAHIVVPCTISQKFQKALPDQESLLKLRRKYGFLPDDIIFVYAGSSAKWQSFDMFDTYLYHWFKHIPKAKLLLLSKSDASEMKTVQAYPERVFQKWLPYDEVVSHLQISDYGILIREKSITNEVAAPTKFAEYLASGLQVLISPYVGDYSAFVEEHVCGKVLEGNKGEYGLTFEQTPYERKQYHHQLAQSYFTKAHFKLDWQKLIAV
ncbi:MAG: hypothetical protein AAF388_17035 [Bacteroidota bacterium]